MANNRLEKALVHDGGRSRSADQLCNFEVRTSRGKVYSLQVSETAFLSPFIHTHTHMHTSVSCDSLHMACPNIRRECSRLNQVAMQICG
jgi:hypothetical protein